MILDVSANYFRRYLVPDRSSNPTVRAKYPFSLGLPSNSVKLIEGVDAMLLTSPSKIEDGLLHRTAQLSPKLFRTKLGVSPVVEGQQSPNDQGRHDLADDASWVPADEMVQLQPVLKPPEDNLNRPSISIDHLWW